MNGDWMVEGRRASRGGRRAGGWSSSHLVPPHGQGPEEVAGCATPAALAAPVLCRRAAGGCCLGLLKAWFVLKNSLKIYIFLYIKYIYTHIKIYVHT